MIGLTYFSLWQFSTLLTVELPNYRCSAAQLKPISIAVMATHRLDTNSCTQKAGQAPKGFLAFLHPSITEMLMFWEFRHVSTRLNALGDDFSELALESARVAIDGISDVATFQDGAFRKMAANRLSGVWKSVSCLHVIKIWTEKPAISFPLFCSVWSSESNLNSCSSILEGLTFDPRDDDCSTAVLFR